MGDAVECFHRELGRTMSENLASAISASLPSPLRAAAPAAHGLVQTVLTQPGCPRAERAGPEDARILKTFISTHFDPFS